MSQHHANPHQEHHRTSNLDSAAPTHKPAQTEGDYADLGSTWERIAATLDNISHHCRHSAD